MAFDYNALIYICIPAFNENSTVGVLLWRIRKTLQEFSREYEVLVYDDGSTDDTWDTLQPYAEVAPLTLLRGEKRQGYAHALDRLAREVARRTRYPRRDAVIFMQADYTDQPEHIPELVKRFEGGADIVVVERDEQERRAPAAVRRLRRVAPWVFRLFVSLQGVRDPFGSFRLYRISLLRELIKSWGEKPLVTADGWAANAEMLMHLAPLARRVDRVSLPARYDLRTRDSRVRPVADSLEVYRFARRSRGRRVTAASEAPVTATVAVAQRHGRTL